MVLGWLHTLAVAGRRARRSGSERALSGPNGRDLAPYDRGKPNRESNSTVFAGFSQLDVVLLDAPAAPASGWCQRSGDKPFFFSASKKLLTLLLNQLRSLVYA